MQICLIPKKITRKQWPFPLLLALAVKLDVLRTYLFELVFLYSLDNYSEVEWLGHNFFYIVDTIVSQLISLLQSLIHCFPKGGLMILLKRF